MTIRLEERGSKSLRRWIDCGSDVASSKWKEGVTVSQSRSGLQTTLVPSGSLDEPLEAEAFEVHLGFNGSLISESRFDQTTDGARSCSRKRPVQGHIEGNVCVCRCGCCMSESLKEHGHAPNTLANGRWYILALAA